MKFQFSFLFLLLSTQILFAQESITPKLGEIEHTIYIGLNGDDENEGTSESPVASFFEAVNKLPFGENGDTIHSEIIFLPGNYTIEEELRQACWQFYNDDGYKAISLAGTHMDSVFLDGSTTPTDNGRFLNLLGNNISVRHLSISLASATDTSGHFAVMDFSNNLVPCNNFAHDLLIDSVRIDGAYDHGININFASNVKISHCEVSNTNLINVDGINDFPGSSTWGSGIKVGRSQKVEISHCHSFQCWGEGIAATNCEEVYIHNNTSSDNYSVNIYADNMIDGIISHNLLYATEGDTSHWRGGGPSAGVAVASEYYFNPNENRSSNIKIFNNIFLNTQAFYIDDNRPSNEPQDVVMDNIYFVHNSIFGLQGDIEENLRAIRINYLDLELGFFKIEDVFIQNNIISASPDFLSSSSSVQLISGSLYDLPDSLEMNSNLYSEDPVVFSWFNYPFDLEDDFVNTEIPNNASHLDFTSIIPTEGNQLFVEGIGFDFVLDDYFGNPRISNNLGALNDACAEEPNILIDGMPCDNGNCQYTICSGDQLDIELQFEEMSSWSIDVSFDNNGSDVTGGIDQEFQGGTGTIGEALFNNAGISQTILYELSPFRELGNCELASQFIEVTVLPAFEYFADNDGDGFGDLENSVMDCSLPGGYVENSLDCDDADPEVNSEASEIPNNDVDEDCDGIALIIDEDGDGFNSDEDCDDLDAGINPGSEEIPNNDVDEDCDGEILIIDEDGDGFNSDEDCDDLDAGINPGSEEIPNNDVDEDCDGEILIIDEDGDGFNSDEDCDDLDAGINPGSEEIPNNDVDEDCDGEILIIDEDGDGFNSDEDCDDADAGINPGQAEIPNNDVDEDCDGEILIIDEDGDGFNSDEDCDDLDAGINPGSEEIPNNDVDEDCDGEILIIDEDGDGFNSDEDCDDLDAGINPGSEEIPNNDIDEDCDGEILIIDEDGDGFNSDEDCDDTNAEINPGAEEIANNGIDEDCDGEDLVSSTLATTLANIKIYPNPSTSLLFVSCDYDQLSFKLFDLTGSLVKTDFIYKGANTISIESLMDGGYYVVLCDVYSGTSSTHLIVKE